MSSSPAPPDGSTAPLSPASSALPAMLTRTMSPVSAGRSRRITPDGIPALAVRVVRTAAGGSAVAAKASATVDYHLNKVFRKLGIRSRAQLHHALAPAPSSS